jgi:hypothetical protein
VVFPNALETNLCRSSGVEFGSACLISVHAFDSWMSFAVGSSVSVAKIVIVACCKVEEGRGERTVNERSVTSIIREDKYNGRFLVDPLL